MSICIYLAMPQIAGHRTGKVQQLLTAAQQNLWTHIHMITGVLSGNHRKAPYKALMYILLAIQKVQQIDMLQEADNVMSVLNTMVVHCQSSSR